MQLCISKQRRQSWPRFSIGYPIESDQYNVFEQETASAVLNEYDDAIGFIQSQVIKYLKKVEHQQRAETDWDDLQLQLDSVPG